MHASLPKRAKAYTTLPVVAPNFDETLAMQAKRGNDIVLSGEFCGVQVAYLPTDRDLGVLIEIFSGASQC
jgi:hypothetical protein